MNKEQLTEALKMLARGRIDAAETIAEFLMPESKTFKMGVPELPEAPKKKFK